MGQKKKKKKKKEQKKGGKQRKKRKIKRCNVEKVRNESFKKKKIP